MVVPTNSHEEARRETSYILPFPARSLSFCAGIALANMVGGAGGGSGNIQFNLSLSVDGVVSG